MGENLGGNALARAMLGAASDVTGDVFKLPVFGTLDEILDLELDGFARKIPKNDYHKLKGLSFSAFDRVLCLPIEDGHTYVLLGLVE